MIGLSGRDISSTGVAPSVSARVLDLCGRVSVSRERGRVRRGAHQDAEGAHALVFVDLSGDIPAFYVTPPDVKVGEVGAVE